MGLVLRQCCRQECRQELRQELRMELRQALQLELMPPTGMSFDEPEPMKRIESFNGRRVIRIGEGEMRSYAEAIRTVYDIMDMTLPDSVLISMRGALPMFRSAMDFAMPGYLDGEGVRWRSRRCAFKLSSPRLITARPRLCRFESRWSIDWGMPSTYRNMLAVKAPTSYFLDDLSAGLERSLRRALGGLVDKSRLVVLFLDTSVTGTKLGWFMPQFTETLKDAAEATGRRIHLVSAILHHKKPGLSHVNDLERKGASFLHTRIDIGVESLLTEDSATLLGAPYRAKDIAEEARGVVRACSAPKKVSIMVGDRFHDIDDEATGKTACLFARIAADEARKRSKSNGF